MAGTKVEDLLLTSGQNEGIDQAVLPAGQLSGVYNARLRSGSRWGKRFGHTALPTAKFGSPARLRAVGGALESCFVVAEDTCYNYDAASADFVTPTAKLAGIGTGLAQRAGAISGWTPRIGYTPAPAYNRQLQTTTPCAQCVGLGYVWTAIQFVSPTVPADTVIRVVATNPADQTLVALWDFSSPFSGFGGNTVPKLVCIGTTILLVYKQNRIGTIHVTGRSLTSIAGGWSAENPFVISPGIAAFDVSPYSSTQWLLAVAKTVASGGATVQLYTAPFTVAVTTAIADSSGNDITAISVVGDATAGVFVGYGVAATPSSKVRTFTAGTLVLVGTGTLSTVDATRPLLALSAAGGVQAIYSSNLASTVRTSNFSVVDVSAAAAVGTPATQASAYPLSMPFVTSNGAIYVWAVTGFNDRAATLLGLSRGATTNAITSLPIELSVQDMLVTEATIDLAGLPVPVLVQGADYSVLLPTSVVTGGSVSGLTIDGGHIFRAVQATHYTSDAAYRSLKPVYGDSCSFVPAGALTRIDDYGAIESGFVHKPAIGGLTPTAGGAMTALADYYYTAVYRGLNSAGRYEVSAPCAPVRVTMGVGQNSVTVPYLPLCISARPGLNANIEIYRTLANGQTFYLTAVRPPQLFLGTALLPTFSDTHSDVIVSAQKALYTQVGQTLPNAFPPASRFGCSGGARVFLGGLVRPDVVHASKLIFGDQSPSFADADAFRLVLPAACTGLAWMDALVLFTAEGIYIASGDGPDDSGIGDFGTLARLPFEIGCIEPRSVIVSGDGCYFQSSRGLHLLPRGFGEPIPAGDNVQRTLGFYPIITGCAALTKTTEQCIYWTCSSNATASSGARIVYDLARKAWAVDTMDSAGAPCGIGPWLGNEIVMFKGDVSVASPLLRSDSSFDDDGVAISMQLSTGDLRPFGIISEGSLIKVQILAALQSACTMVVSKFTEWGGSSPSRVFALAPGDYSVGQLTVTDVELGPTEAREAVKLSLQISETSTAEGLALIAISLEHEQGEGLKRASPLSRVT